MVEGASTHGFGNDMQESNENILIALEALMFLKIFSKNLRVQMGDEGPHTEAASLTKMRPSLIGSDCMSS